MVKVHIQLSRFLLKFLKEKYVQSKNSDLDQLLCETSLIIWDGVSMQDCFCQEAVDMTMRDIRDRDIPFGGVTVVFGGDFQQILPVVCKGRQEQIVGQCIQRSELWCDIKVLYLKENKRLSSGSDEDKEYAEWLLKVGHGSIQVSVLLTEQKIMIHDSQSIPYFAQEMTLLMIQFSSA